MTTNGSRKADWMLQMKLLKLAASGDTTEWHPEQAKYFNSRVTFKARADVSFTLNSIFGGSIRTESGEVLKANYKFIITAKQQAKHQPAQVTQHRWQGLSNKIVEIIDINRKTFSIFTRTFLVSSNTRKLEKKTCCEIGKMLIYFHYISARSIKQNNFVLRQRYAFT